MEEGDIVKGDKGGEFVIGSMVAYQGKEGCIDPRCSRVDGKCRGWHCPVCHKPCSMIGHRDCQGNNA